MATLWQDMKFAVRTLRKRWMVTTLAILSLALAIGGNAAVFSMVDAFLFRPLPYPSPDRLVLVGERQKDQPEFSSSLGTSLPSYADWRERSRFVGPWGALQPTTFSVRGADQAEPVTGVRIAGDFFEVLEVSAVRGRLFTPAEMVEGGPKVVLLGYDRWINTYGGGTDPLGDVLTLNGDPHTVIGVLPQGFEFLTPGQDLWTPLSRSPQSAARDQRTVLAIGRIREGATMEQVRAEMTQLAADLEVEYPDTQRNWTVDTFNMRYDIPTQQTRILFAMLQGSVLLVLLIACVNITNLLLARGQERAREIALRTVLGADRLRIVRQLLTESSIMVAIGAIVGMGLAVLGIRAMAAQFVGLLPANFAIQLDERVMLFTLVISVLAGLLFGTVPAFQTFRHGQSETLKDGGGRGGSGRGRKTLTKVLVIGEIALSFVALGGGSLLIRSFLQVQAADPGFEAGPILTASVSVPTSKYPEAEDRVLLNDQILDKARTLAGIEFAAIVSALPQAPIAATDTFRALGQPVSDGGPIPRAVVVQASSEYLDAMGVDLLEGRFFTESDRLETAPVAVVNRALVDAWYAGRSPIGQYLEVRGDTRQIVGVTEDIQQVLIQTGSGVSGETIYLPAAQEPVGANVIVVRTAGDPRTLGEPLRTSVQALDPDMALAQVLTMEEYVAQFFVGIQVFNVVLGVFGAIALLLASLGTYGMLAYSVNRRSHEIGIRLALGAEGRTVVRMIARQGFWLAVIGLGIGTLLTLPLVGVLRSLLQGLSTVQPSTLVLIGGLLFLVTMVASLVPASRAATVDPMRTLREE